jgi:HlyD family secretion protein
LTQVKAGMLHRDQNPCPDELRQESDIVGSSFMSTNVDYQAPPRDMLLPAVRPAPGGPVAILPSPRPNQRRQRPWLALVAVIVAAAAAGGGYWWLQSAAGLPEGIVSGNGRLEADEIDVATKFAGRIAELLVDEGDMVRSGQVVARMDTKDVDISLHKAEAQVLGAERMLDEARASVEQQQAQVTLAHQELSLASFLFQKGYGTGQLLDQRRQQEAVATAALTVARARVGEAEQTLAAATRDVDHYRINIADNALTAARDGRIQYRLANVGEVLAVGGKVFTMLDVNYVYLDIFLPTADAGRTIVGADARIVLDALPTTPIPAKVVFVADQAQFTPKAVETKTERDKLMFRVRVRVDQAFLVDHAAEVRSGLPGVAYVRFDPRVDWPAALQPGQTGVSAR